MENDSSRHIRVSQKSEDPYDFSNLESELPEELLEDLHEMRAFFHNQVRLGTNSLILHAYIKIKYEDLFTALSEIEGNEE